MNGLVIMKQIIVMYSTRKSTPIMLVFSLILVLCSATLSSNSLTARHSNQGYVTDYTFQFQPSYAYAHATVRIGFPVQYSLSSFQQQLNCQISNSGTPNDYRAVDCWIQPTISLLNFYLVGYVVVEVNNILNTSPFYVLLQNVINPINRSITSFFTLCIEMNSTPIECDKTFAQLLLTPPPPASIHLANLTTNPQNLVVGQGSTYLFTLQISNFGSWYSESEFMSVRVILPNNFTTKLPLCSVSYNITTQDVTYRATNTTTFASRSSSIECSRITGIQKYLSNGRIISFKIQTITNPLGATTWSGAYIQIVRSIHNQVVEVVPLRIPIVTVVQQFMGSVIQHNNFRNATTLYVFNINHDVILGDLSSLQIIIGNSSSWTIHSANIITGFTSPQTLQTVINNNPTGSSVLMTNYGIAHNSVQQRIALNITSSLQVGYQAATIKAKINYNDVGIWTGAVYLNETYGECSLLSLTAVRKKIKLPANSTGSLELRFFLNYQLPQSQGLTNGSIQLSVSPQLTQPHPDINGVLKCYFKGVYQASDCTFDNSNPLKTLITVVSPPLEAFQYSEIPIVITTQGAINQQNIGFPIDPLVTRYKFQTEFYLYNSSSIPSEVYYSQWIADAQLMNSVSITSLTKQCKQRTNIQVNLNMPLLSSLSLQGELRILVQFISDPVTGINAWDPYLGYGADRIYKEYPCIVLGLTGTRIRCDLYTYTKTLGPYNNLDVNPDLTGPYFIIYGFINTITTGTAVTIELPDILIGNVANVPALIKVSILEETPAQLEPFVELYVQNVTAFWTFSPTAVLETIVPSSQVVPISVQTTVQYNITWNPLNPTNIKYIKYELLEPYFPSFSTVSSACSTSACFSAGLPANWIVEQPTLPVTFTYLMQTLSSFITTIPFLSTKSEKLPFHITTYDAVGNTIDKVAMPLPYQPQQLIGYFEFIELIVYAGLAQWYSISFATPLVTVSSYPYLRISLSSNMQFSLPIQCNSTSLTPYNETGFQYTVESPQSILIWNIAQIIGGSTYQMNCRLRTDATQITGSITPKLNIELHHNFTIQDSYVAVVDNVILKQAPITAALAKPVKFQIDNPQIINSQPIINYVGPLFIDFTSNYAPSYSSNFSLTLDLVLHNHRYNKAGWTPPNGLNTDPLVCFLNGKRCSCSWTSDPLTFSMKNPSIKIGSNKLQFTSEYVAPYNGIKFPGSAGQYWAEMTFLNSSSGITLFSHSFFVEIKAHPLLHFQAASIVKDIGTQSVYIVNFTLPTWRSLPKSYNDNSNYSRIFVQFPTNVGGAQVFDANLGGYQGLINQEVGCSFLTGGSYITPIVGLNLQCRFIPSAFNGGNVKIEIINFAAFTSITANSLAVFIYKIFNPSLPYRSFDVIVSITQTEVSTGNIYPIFESKYTIFLDPQSKNPSPLLYQSQDSSTTVSFFDPALSVGANGAITLKAQAVSGNTLTAPFYVIYKLPSYLPPENTQVPPAFKSCPTAQFQLCLTAPEINYVMVKAKTNLSSFQVYINNYPNSISQQDSLFEALVIESGRFTGKLIYTISASFRWKSLMGSMTFNSVQPVGLSQKLDINKQNAQIMVSFTTSHYIPSSGSIEIVFPSSIAIIRSDCRSATALGSILKSLAGNSGQVGCSIQNGNHWVITSFQPLAANSLVIIRGFINLPSVSGTIGAGQIISYADTSNTDIYSNGSRIDYVKCDFALIVSTSMAMNPNEQIFLSQRSVLRQGYVGQFRIIFSSNYVFKTTDYLELSMYVNDIKGNPGGFQLTSRPKVCQFVRIDTQQKIGCYLNLQMQTVIFRHEAIVYQVVPIENLVAAVSYQLRLTSQDYVLPEGIQFPTSPSIYKIDVLLNHTLQPAVIMEQEYIEVYGVSFTQLVLTQFNYIAGTYSPFWLSLIPAVDILTTHQIILQFPTLSNDGITVMFSNDLGWSSTISDGGSLPFDVFECLPFITSFMTCRLFYGDYLRAIPAKIICGGFSQKVLAGQLLRFAFAITNPLPMTTGTLSQISLPIFIYSYDPYSFQKINYNTINVGAYVNNVNQFSIPNGYFSTATGQLQTPNEQLFFANNNARPLLVNDAYVIKFNFPLRVNTTITPKCTNAAGLLFTYGNAYYHQNLMTVVCLLTSTLPANVIPSAANLRLTGFYSPWYGLNVTERQVYAIASYQSSTDSEYISYFDPFPSLSPRYQGLATLSVLSMTEVLPHKTACQLNDYVFKVQLQNLAVSTNFNLQYTQLILLQIPFASADYAVMNTDCLQHFSSTIEIIFCAIDTAAGGIVIKIVPGVYNNAEVIAVQTRGLAIRNPCIWWWGVSMSQWSAYFMSFKSGSPINAAISNAYLVINSLNMQPFPLSFIQETAASTVATYYTFDWFQIPHERYYNQFLQFNTGQYSPFSFEIQLTADILAPPTGSYHVLTLTYGTDYLPCGSQVYAKDLSIYTPVCYLMNTRISACSINQTNNSTTMKFDFKLTAGKAIHVYFSVLEPTNPQYNGYEYVGLSDISQIIVTLTALGNTYTFQTPPFEAQQTPAGAPGLSPVPGISLGTINYANCVAGAINVVDMILTVSRSDITALRFQIPMIDSAGNDVFGASSQTSFFNLLNGDQYPCGNHQPSGVIYTGNPRCYIFYGQNTFIGSPVQIIMTDLNQGSTINARLLLTNPSFYGVWPWISVNVYAYAGIQDVTSIYGNKYAGSWNFNNVYQLCSGAPVSNNVLYSNYLTPNYGLWRENTQWTLAGSVPWWPYSAIPVSSYVILEVMLQQDATGTTDDIICETNFALNNLNTDDMIILKSRESATTYKKAFFVKKWTGSWLIKYFKCKHYNIPLIVHYSLSTTNVQLGINYFQKGSPYTGSVTSATFNCLSSSSNRTYIELDVTSQINLILAEGFIWDINVNYVMQISLNSYIYSYPQLNVQACKVVEGFISSSNNLVTCLADYWGTTITIKQFTSLILNKRLGQYRLKIELQHTLTTSSQSTYSGYFYYYATIAMYAGPSAFSSLWYVYSVSTPTYSYLKYYTIYNTQLVSSFSSCYTSQSPLSLWPTFTTYRSSTNQLSVNILNVGMNAALTTLKLHLTLTPKVAINMYSASYPNSYPQFRFYVNNFKFNCNSFGFVKFLVTYHQNSTNTHIPANYAASTSMVSCNGANSQIGIFYYNKFPREQFGTIWGPESTTFDPLEWLQFDIQVVITGFIEPVFYRDWISITTSIDTYQFDKKYIDCDTLGFQWTYNMYFLTVSTSEDYWLPINLLASVNLQPLSNNVNEPTEMKVTIATSALQFGNNFAKILLLELNSNINPFTYLNTTSALSKIECKCVSDLNPATVLSPNCLFRPGTLTGMMSAITVNMEVSLLLGAYCYFPHWYITNGSLMLTAKLMNDEGGYPTYYTNRQLYSAYYQMASNTLTFTTSPVISPALVSETSNPALYSPTTFVNTFLQDYTLTITVPATTSQPIIYVDFQKAGIIPDSQFCTNTFFLQCRVYTTLIHVLVAQFKSSWTGSSSLVIDSNFAFFTYLPKHQESGTDFDYNLQARILLSSTDIYYSYKGNISRVAANLLPTNIQVTVVQQISTGTLTAGQNTNILISFTLGGQFIYSYTTNNQAAIMITSSNVGLLTTKRGCTVVASADPFFQFDCMISGNTLTIMNKYDNVYFNRTGLIQVIVGIVNPNNPVNFTVKGYQYKISATNYGLIFTGIGTYTPIVLPGTVMLPTQINMYPFYTKIYDDGYSPLRLRFKLSSTPFLPTVLSFASGYQMLLADLDMLSPYSNFKCLFKSYALDPTLNTQNPFPNSYRNLKQQTQHQDLYVNCWNSITNKTALYVQVPRSSSLLTTHYYELVVMPVGPGVSPFGFANAPDTLFKFIGLPNSCEHINKIDKYIKNIFTLNQIYIVTKRPLYPTALYIDFSMKTDSFLIYPKHYLQIVFRDMDISAIQSPYNTPGSYVPCTLSPLFIAVAGATQSPHCIVQQIDKVTNAHGTILIRVVSFGNLVAGNYSITLDNFLLPDMTTPLQDSSPFTTCLRFFTSNGTHYERCFGQLFVIDGVTSTTPEPQKNGSLTISNNTYGATNIFANLNFQYPLNSLGYLSQKIMVQINGGYSGTTAAPISLLGYSPLWYNSMINLYIYQQNVIALNANTTFTLLNLVNPKVLQFSSYSTGINTITMNFYDSYQPITIYSFNQPAFSYFALQAPLIYASTVLYFDDVRQNVPFYSSIIYQFQIIILESPADIITKQINNIKITFGSNVSLIERCWVQTNTLSVAFQLNGQCQVGSGNTVWLYSLSQANTTNNLTLYVQMQLSGTNVTYDSQTYCSNGQLQYYMSSTQIFTDISSSINTYPYLDFTQNMYTKNYYEQQIARVTTSTPVNYLYLSLNLPADLTHKLTVFKISLPAIIAPNNATVQTRMICEWLTVDTYGRKYITGEHSVCSYSSPNILVNAPFGGLPRLSSTGQLITYLLKIREFYITKTLFQMPSTSASQEILLSHTDSTVQKQDTLIIYPYSSFQSGKLSVTTYTLTAGEYNTYNIAFTPLNTISVGKEAVLELSIDPRYWPSDLGMNNLFAEIGVDTSNISSINYQNFNVAYPNLPTKWVNALPYSAYTTTLAAPQHTCIHATSVLRAVLLLQPNYVAGTAYNWQIPLIINPSAPNITFRFNLTLYTYQAGTGRPQKELFSEIINPYMTVQNSSSSLNYSLSTQANIQSTTSLGINLEFPFVPDTTSLIELKISNRGVGLINLPDFYSNSLPTASYTFYFFQRVNLLLGVKKFNDSSTTINLPSFEQTNFYVDYYGYDWVKVHSTSLVSTTWNAGRVLQLLQPCNITTITSTLLEGSNLDTSSAFLQQFAFTTTCLIQQNSTFAIQFNSSQYNWAKESPCYTSFKSIGCIYTGGNLLINVNQNISDPSTIIVSVYLESQQANGVNTSDLTASIYALPQNSNTITNSIPLLATLPFINSSAFSQGAMENLVILPLYQNTRMQLRGTIIPRYLPLTTININHPFSQTLTSIPRFLYRQNTTALLDKEIDLNFIEASHTSLSSTSSNIVFQPNGLFSYDFAANNQYSFIMSSTYDTNKLNNFSIGPVGKFYNFVYSTNSEIQYEEVYPLPVPNLLTILNPIMNVNQQTALGFKFVVPTQVINPGDIISISLDSHNLLNEMYQFTSTIIDCVEGVSGVLTSSATLICTVTQYPQNKLPLVIDVYVKKVVPVNTPIQIWISPIINSGQEMVAGAIVKVSINCLGQQRCVIYQANGYYRTTNSPLIVNQPIGSATFSPSNSEVLKKSIIHSYTFISKPVTSIFLLYPQNYDNVMPITCTHTLGKCLVFPHQKLVLILPTVASAISSLILNNMNNGFYVCPASQYIYTVVVSASEIDVYKIVHPNLTTIKTNYLRNTPNSMTITPTQSPNVFLRNYMNTAIIQITGIYTAPQITAFYLQAPSDVVTWDNTYCNATMTANYNNPYPIRLNCLYESSTTIAITIPEGVSYVYNITDGYTITVNCKFLLADFPINTNILYVSPPTISNAFNAYGSHSVVDDYHYYMTQASQTISISEHQIPPIANIQFTTESYIERMANVNDVVSFDMLLDPTTTQPISLIEIMLPQMFKYPAVSNLTACQLISRSTIPLNNCHQIRSGDQTFIRIVPPSTYTNSPIIITIADQNTKNWFTAPSFPGNWYNFTVSLYSSNGTLLQKQYSANCTPIGGLDLDIPSMAVQNGRDANTEELVDVTFVVGSLAIPQGYTDALQTGEYYTSINIAFQNWQAYDNLLGSQQVNNTLVGCVTKGLTANRQIQCMLVGGGDIQHEPAIVVTGYQWVTPFTSVTISLANIMMLSATKRNVLSVSVLIRQIGSWKQSFLYNPQQLILHPTVNLVTVPFNYLDLGYSSLNIVGSPTIFYITINPSIDINTYFVIKMPEDLLNNQYNLFNYNWTQANKVEIFYRSAIIRIYPLNGVHLKGVQITYTIFNFPSAQYVMQFPNCPVTVEAYKDYQQVQSQIFSLNIESYPCTLNFSLITLSSLYTFDQNLTYTFAVDLAANPLDYKNNLTLALIFPSEFKSLTSRQISCQVSKPLTCNILSSTKIEISEVHQSPNNKIIIKVTGLTNPSSLAHSFTIQSYKGRNMDRVMCMSTTTKTLLKSNIMSCSLRVGVSQITGNQQANYKFTILCPQPFKNNTQIKIKLHKDYMLNNRQSHYNCWSDNPLNLLASKCQLIYQDASFYLIFDQIYIEYNQISLSLNAAFKNPIFSKIYFYSANITIQDFSYGISNSPNLSFSLNQINTITAINMFTFPTAAGAKSIYILKIGTKFVSNQLQIEFPFEYQLNADIATSTYYSNDSNWIANQSYFDLLQYSYKTQTNCSIALIGNHQHSLTALNLKVKPNTTWLYLLLRFITNPSYYDNSIVFTVKSINFNNELQYLYVGPFSIQINISPSSIHMVGLNASDSDLQTLATYNITYRVDEPVYTNKTSFIITPPPGSPLFAINTLNCCLIYGSSQIVQCHLCNIGKYELQFVVQTVGLLLQTDQFFTIQMTSMYTPQKLNECLALQDFESSYFDLMIFRNDITLTHKSIRPSSDDFTPCQILQPVRGDILFNPPNILYAGLAYNVSLIITRPSKMVRVNISTLNKDLSFSPNQAYFNSYDVIMKQVFVLVSPNANPAFTYINVTHQESIVYNLLRDNLPVKVQIRNDRVEYVVVHQAEAFMIGKYIRIPVSVTVCASYDIYLRLLPVGASSQFDFETTVIKIAALTNQTFFNFRYTGKLVPSTLNASLALQSPFTLRHVLKPQIVYFYFSVTNQFQTLPPVMKLNVIYQYQSNSQHAGRNIYNINSSPILYDQLQPQIIAYSNMNVGSTRAQIMVFTRHQAEVYYIIRQRGNELLSPTPKLIRESKEAEVVKTFRNSSHYVNAYNLINFTRLEHQTIYKIYLMAHDSLGDSANWTFHSFMTAPLSSAVQIRLDTISLVKDSVYIVHRISEILNIDIHRVKVVDSYILKDKAWSQTTNAHNPLLYRNLIVISPSSIDDTVSPLQLVSQKFINSTYNRKRLAQIMPEFVDNILQRIGSLQNEDLPLVALNPSIPKIKQVPKAVKISYYNAVFNFSLWSQAIIYAVAQQQSEPMSFAFSNLDNSIEGKRITNLSDDIPYSKQIILGHTSTNAKADRVFNITTDSNGYGVINLSVLKPKTSYLLYLTVTTYPPYQPILYGLTENIIKLKFFTLQNPNLKDNAKAFLLPGLMWNDPQLYQLIQQHIKEQQKKDRVQ